MSATDTYDDPSNRLTAVGWSHDDYLAYEVDGALCDVETCSEGGLIRTRSI